MKIMTNWRKKKSFRCTHHPAALFLSAGWPPLIICGCGWQDTAIALKMHSWYWVHVNRYFPGFYWIRWAYTVPKISNRSDCSYFVWPVLKKWLKKKKKKRSTVSACGVCVHVWMCVWICLRVCTWVCSSWLWFMEICAIQFFIVR